MVHLLRHLLLQFPFDPTGLTASVTSSDSFYNDSILTCSSSASDIDPEDAVLSYTYVWSTGDTGADLILDSSMMPGTSITCTVQLPILQVQ